MSGICEAAGISRKTGYEWESRSAKSDKQAAAVQRELDELKSKHADLAALYKDTRFENA